MKIIKFSKKYLAQHKVALLFFTFITIMSTSISVISPYIVGNFLDDLINEGDFDVVFRFSIIFISLNIFKIIKNYVTSIMQEKVYLLMTYNLIQDIINHVQRLSLSIIDQFDLEYLNQRIRLDANTLIGFSIQTTKNILVNAMIFIAPLIVLLHINQFVYIPHRLDRLHGDNRPPSRCNHATSTEASPHSVTLIN